MRTRLLLILILVVIELSMPTIASATPGTYSISLTPDRVSVSITGSLVQNVTTTSAFQFTLAGTNSTIVTQNLNRSLQRLDNQVWVENPILRAVSNGTLLTYNLTFSVLGATRSYLGGSSSADLSWRSFDVREDILANGVSFNLLGNHELGQTLVTLAKNSLIPTPGHSEITTFQMGAARVSPLQIEQLAPNLNLLDFSSLSSSLDSWSGGFNLDSQETSWTNQAGFDILAKVSLTEAMGQTLTTVEQATYSVAVTLTAPGLAQREGNLVYFGSNFLEPVFAELIAVILGMLAIAFFVDRRLVRNRRFRPKRK